MAFQLTDDQQSLWDTVARSFKESFSSEQLRAALEGRYNREAIKDSLKALGLSEYFSDPSSSSLVELSLVAFSSGYSLVPFDVSGSLYFGPFLVSRFQSYGDKIRSHVSDEAQIYDGTAQITVATASNGHLDFCSISDPVAIVSDVQYDEAKVSFPLESGDAHPCLDLTYPRYRMKASAQFEIGQESGEVISGWHVLVASELSGIAVRVVEMTREYVLTRKQFGAPVGSFQAVQQQLADSYLKSEACWALTQFAAWAYENDPNQRLMSSRSALENTVSSVPEICETAIQLHGGIGFTWEYDLHLFLRRAQFLSSLYRLTERQQIELLEELGR